MVERAMTPRTKLIILNSPNNPSGAVMSREDMTAIVALGARARHLCHLRRVLCLSRTTPGISFSAGEVQDAKEHLVIVGSLSKTYAMTGWRAGYALAPAPICQRHAEAAEPVDLESDFYRAEGRCGCVERDRRIASKRCAQDYIKPARPKSLADSREIPGMTCTVPQGAFYAYPNVSAYSAHGGMKSACRSWPRSLLTRSARSLRARRGLWNDTATSVCSYATSQKEVDRGLERMKKFFASSRVIQGQGCWGHRGFCPATFFLGPQSCLCDDTFHSASHPSCWRDTAAPFTINRSCQTCIHSCLKPFFSERIWGTRDLSSNLSGSAGEQPIGEAWLTGESMSGSERSDGTANRLARFRRSSAATLVGETAPQPDRFPLLIKFLFPHDKLSVQVHPDDEHAQTIGPAVGKDGMLVRACCRLRVRRLDWTEARHHS